MSEGHLTEEEIRLQKVQSLRSRGINPYTYKFHKTDSVSDVISRYGNLGPEAHSQDQVTVAGRVIAKRGHGKATFGNIMDISGTIQYYAKIDRLGDQAFDDLVHLDVGDIIGIVATPFRSKRGELTLEILSFELLTKSIHPLPEKYHGLQDKELRYRQRYVDLIS
ncbi:lysine--tRNA ligase, partial [bacterium]|nr:lysine--tRNA ligase [bacterium]